MKRKKMQKPPIVFCSDLNRFNSLKISIDSDNSSYITNNVIIYDEPEIYWEQIVIILEEKIIWTHGILIDCNNLSGVDLENYYTKTEIDKTIGDIETLLNNI